jgi:hypothetical protein
VSSALPECRAASGSRRPASGRIRSRRARRRSGPHPP